VVVHGSILATVPLTVKVRRSGGLSGLGTSTSAEVPPGSVAHDAARRLCAERPSSPTPRPDGFRYDVSIASPRRTVLHRTFADPLPDAVAALVTALPPPEPVAR
jgi:hypothetical protein